MIWVSSDLHFNHDREFIYVPRGFKTVGEMNETILKNFKEDINSDDEVYLLGDLMLGGPDKMEQGLEFIREIPGRLHLVRGNHDTKLRWANYAKLPNVVELKNAIYLDYHKYHFYMSHYVSLTGNLEKESLHQCTINLYGHTHQMNNFYRDIPFLYHVGVDSHNCHPIALDSAIEEMKLKIKECCDQL